MFLTFPSPTHAYNALAALQGHRHKGAQRVVTLDFVQPPVEDVADPLLDDSLSTGSPRGSFESDAMHGLVRTPSSAGVSHMVTPELARQRSLTSVSSVIDDTSSDEGTDFGLENVAPPAPALPPPALALASSLPSRCSSTRRARGCSGSRRRRPSACRTLG